MLIITVLAEIGGKALYAVSGDALLNYVDRHATWAAFLIDRLVFRMSSHVPSI